MVALKRDFRLRWAQEQINENTTIQTTKLESYQIVDSEAGTYEPLEMIVVHEGGKDSPQAWQAALNYLRVAMTLGGMWMQFNNFTQRVDILYVKKTRRTVFQQKWAMFTETTRLAKLADGAAVADVQCAETPEKFAEASKQVGAAEVLKEEPPAKRARGGAPKPGAVPKPETPQKPKPSEQDKDNQRLFRNCTSLKTTYLKVCTVQTNMLRVLSAPEDADVAWSALANPANIENLNRLMGKVTDSTTGDFQYSFLNGDVAQLKKDYTGKMSEFWHSLRSFESVFSVAIKCLDVEQQRLHRMYRAGKQ
jgi:hypothetical protein